MRVKALDIAIAVAAAILVAGSAAWAYRPGSGVPSAVVEGRAGTWVYPLDSARRIGVEGPLGTTLVVIEGGTVRVEDSPCPNKTCVAAGRISRPGQWTACLPNRVIVRVEGKTDGVDASTY